MAPGCCLMSVKISFIPIFLATKTHTRSIGGQPTSHKKEQQRPAQQQWRHTELLWQRSDG